MTHAELMRLAYEAGAKDHSNPDQWGILTISHDDIERLAAFVMLYEREECAKLADKYMERWTADAIRARGEK